jgi:hypothetical protein
LERDALVFFFGTAILFVLDIVQRDILAEICLFARGK